VWEYFVNEEYHDKNRCTVPNDKGEKCGLHIAGIHSFISSIYIAPLQVGLLRGGQ